MDTAGAVLDTMFLEPQTIWAVLDPGAPRGFGAYRPQPFADNDLVRLSPVAAEYVVVGRRMDPDAEQATFSVARIRVAGDTLFHRDFAYDPVPIPAGAPDSLAQAWGAMLAKSRFAGAPTPATAAAWARDGLYVPAHHPPVRDLIPGIDGTIWLERARDASSSEWLVLDPDGTPLHRVRLPANVTVMAASRDRVWGVETDELDVPYIVRYGVGPTRLVR